MDTAPTISVIIPVLNGESTIGDCIASIIANDYPSDRREILVVDNGSRDGTAKVVSKYPVRYMKEGERGASVARNHAIPKSKGEIVAFIDCDCLASTSWLSELAIGFRAEDVGGVAGEILPFPPRTPAERYAAQIRHLSPRRYLQRPFFPFAVTANLAFRKEVFDRVGLFDPRSPRGGESTDFCTRFFRNTGMKLDFCPKAAVFHRHRTTALDLLRQQYSYGRGHAFLYRKYRDEIPWGWPERIAVWRDFGGGAWDLMRKTMVFMIRRSDKEQLYFSFFSFLRKLGIRTGFARESFSRKGAS